MLTCFSLSSVVQEPNPNYKIRPVENGDSPYKPLSSLQEM